MKRTGPYRFKNIGYSLHEFAKDNLVPIRQEIEQIQENFALAEPTRKSLAGNIFHEYYLSESNREYLENLILPVCLDYDNAFNYLDTMNFLSEGRPLALNRPWVNFQRKHEFNPSHNHSGIFSWVIWLDIPYTLQEELSASPGRESNQPSAGCFEFSYINSLGQITLEKLPVDKSWENTMALFPSSMIHSVYPFYSSDEFRISVSGNFIFKV